MQIANAEEIRTSNPDWQYTLKIDDPTLEKLIVNFDGVDYEINIIGLTEYTWTPPVPLTEGRHSVTFRYDDLAKNPGYTSAFLLTLDTTPPDRPLVITARDDEGARTGSIDTGGRSDDTTPTLRGAAEPGSLVIIYNSSNQPIASGYAEANGYWEITIPLNAGTHALHVTATDSHNFESAPSDVFNLSVGPDGTILIIEPAPVIARDNDDVQVNNAHEIVTDDPAWQYTLAIDDPTLEWLRVNFDGVDYKIDIRGLTEYIWTPPPGTFTEGRHTVSFRYDDLAKNPGKSSVFVLNLDTTAPERPLIVNAYDDRGSTTGSIDTGGRSDDDTPVLRGAAEPGSLVILYNDNNQPLASTYARSNGYWEIAPVLAAGEHQLHVTATDSFNHVSVPSEAFSLTIGPDPLIPAQITHAEDNQGPATGRLISGALTDDATPRLHGTASPDARVSIQYRNADGSWQNGGDVITRLDGNWYWDAPGLQEGQWEFRASTVSGGWSAPFSLQIDLTPQDRIEITHAWDNEGLYQGELSSGAFTDDRTPTLHGRAEANSLVYVHVRQSAGEWLLLGSMQADTTGNWSMTSDRLFPGQYQFQAGASIEPGNTGAPFELQVLSADPTSPQIVGIYDDVGTITGWLSNPDVTDDRTPHLEGRAPVGTVVVIYQDGLTIGSTVATGGLWQFDVPALAPDNTYRFTTAIRDAAGDEGTPSPAWVLDVTDTTQLPVNIIFTGMTADSGVSASDWVTNDGSANRTLSGILSRQLAQGETLLIHNGSEWLRATVNGLTWTLVDTAAHDSSWQYQATVENAITGTTTPPIDQQVVFDNTTVSPVISGLYDNSATGEKLIVDGASTTDTTPLLRGTAESDSLVYIYREGVSSPVGSVKALNGQWNFISPELPPGSHRFYVVAEDIAGNRATSGSYGITTASASRGWDFEGYEHNDRINPVFIDGLKIRQLYDSSMPALPALPVVKQINDSPINDNKWLYCWNDANFEFEKPVYEITFDFAKDIPEPFSLVVTYYNASGGVVKVSRLSGTSQLPDVHATFDQPITSFTVDTNPRSFRIDNIEVGYSRNRSLSPEEAQQLEESVVLVQDMQPEQGRIDLHQMSDAPFNLSVETVMQQGHYNLFIDDGKTQLLIAGDEAHSVQLIDLLPDGSDWRVQAGTVTVAGVEYQVYHHNVNSAEVLIERGINTDLT
ncbi:Ig-like domain-containing protein [Duffyella gerundensis]|uniref:Ig-like domain-containing protein n=1 Tax=Duffyella gerundensis TaxID=1619313 RepID=UPI0021F7A11F|nr:Ig-like domain-containing protein [Duffyella gerundensis]